MSRRHSASQIVHAIHGAKPNQLCGPLDPFVCWVCGCSSDRGVLRHKWMGANFTGQNRVRCPDSSHVCEACVTVMAGRPPDTERMWSHFVEGESHARVNKGGKPEMREFLRRTKRDRWFAAIADSGKKHIIPWCPVNLPGQSGGHVLFEESIVELPREEHGWSLIDEIATLLTDGATKEEIGRGEYGPRAWQLLGGRLRKFESTRGHLRGGTWFALAVWLAQRDEEKVAERLAAEKAAKVAQRAAAKLQKGKRDDRGATRKAKKSDDRRVAGTEGGVPRDAGVQRPEALGPTPGPNARGGTAKRNARGVANDHDADVATGGPEVGQLALFS